MSRRAGEALPPRGDWQTPRWLLDALRSELGPIGLDPCTTSENPTNARRILVLDDGFDGLTIPWSSTTRRHEWAFVNPPFSAAKAWAEKALEESRKGAEIVLLLPASVNSRRFRTLTNACDALAVFDRRVSYVDPTTVEEMRGADFDSACWYFGARRWSFAAALRHHATRIVRGHGWISSEPAPAEKAQAAE